MVADARFFAFIVWLALIVFCAASVAKADVVTDWNTAALNAIRALSTTPPAAARSLAILHTSIYDTINGSPRTHAPYFVIGHVATSASIEAAASAAAHGVMVSLYPSLQATFDALYSSSMAGIPDSPHTQVEAVTW